jgi:NADPH:quinone reductase
VKALTINDFGTPPRLRDDLPTPTLGPGDVLVRVQASSVNPVDNSIAAGMLRDMVEHEFPVTLGRDYSGVVEHVGADVTRYALGDEVYGFLMHANPTVRDGSWAELISVSEEVAIARRPAGVDIATAGAAPLAAITAMTAVDALELSEGNSVLVAGATGGVGSFAVQLAAQAGAMIVAPALPEDEQYLGDRAARSRPRPGRRRRGRGARARRRRPEVALLDLVNNAPGSFDGVLKEGGRVASPTGAAGEGAGRTNVMAQPTTENLERVARLLDSGALRVPALDTYELERAPEALQALATTHTQGKLAIRVA